MIKLAILGHQIPDIEIEFSADSNSRVIQTYQIHWKGAADQN